MVEVALFPIPNSVNFPGVPCALHVFEPRYRQMVRHCIETDMLMGICHTEKVLHDGGDAQSMSEALSSNQSTYKPCRIFSARRKYATRLIGGLVTAKCLAHALRITTIMQHFLSVTDPHEHVGLDAVPDHLPVAWFENVECTGYSGEIHRIGYWEQGNLNHYTTCADAALH